MLRFWWLPGAITINHRSIETHPTLLKLLIKTYPTGSMYGIFACIYQKNQPNVGKYASPMDPMGIQTFEQKQRKTSLGDPSFLTFKTGVGPDLNPRNPLNDAIPGRWFVVVTFGFGCLPWHHLLWFHISRGKWIWSLWEYGGSWHQLWKKSFGRAHSTTIPSIGDESGECFVVSW